MIQLTRLNHQPLLINSDLIELIEETPDTVITMTTGKKILVAESCAQICARIVEFRFQCTKGGRSQVWAAVEVGG
jgi:flagellar protein FlbD